MGTDKEKLNIYYLQSIARANRQHCPKLEVLDVSTMEERIKDLLKEYQDKVDFYAKEKEFYKKDGGVNDSSFIYAQEMVYYFSGAVQALKRLLP